MGQGNHGRAPRADAARIPDIIDMQIELKWGSRSPKSWGFGAWYSQWSSRFVFFVPPINP